YIQYTFRRSEGVLDDIFPRTNISLWSRIYFGVLFLLLAIQDAVAFTSFITDSTIVTATRFISSISQALSGILALLFDMVCLYAFVRYMSRTRVDEQPVDPRFMMTARYGVVACACALMTLCTFIVFLVDVSRLILYPVMVLFCQTGLGVLCGLKVALFYEKRRKAEGSALLESAEKGSTPARSRKDTALGMDSLNKKRSIGA
ncbi:hypothetical protein BC830DRAFT_1175544, partial [Chytriomyces sp. MP71]